MFGWLSSVAMPRMMCDGNLLKSDLLTVLVRWEMMPLLAPGFSTKIGKWVFPDFGWNWMFLVWNMTRRVPIDPTPFLLSLILVLSLTNLRVLVNDGIFHHLFFFSSPILPPVHPLIIIYCSRAIFLILCRKFERPDDFMSIIQLDLLEMGQLLAHNKFPRLEMK